MNSNTFSRIILILLTPLLFLSMAPTDLSNNPNKSKIIYVFDPMCGWCYGFSKVMDQYENQHKNKYDFEVISGGMVVGEREGPIGDFADYILSAYKRVEEYSGITYGEPYLAKLRDKSLWSSSVMPSIAIETFKRFEPSHVVEFSSAVQRAYFYEGKDLRNTAVYTELIKPYNINSEAFLTLLQSEEMRLEATRGYQTAANFGVTGYPAVILQHKGKYYMVAKGFTDYNTFAKTIETVENKY